LAKGFAAQDPKMCPSDQSVPGVISTSAPTPITDDSCIAFSLSQIRDTIWPVEESSGQQ
jgi:hypothetical protein